jgi:serine phosphatase RsbU (regulator of sigma subunit)/tetratricopeptide (TPR) repeat protein
VFPTLKYRLILLAIFCTLAGYAQNEVRIEGYKRILAKKEVSDTMFIRLSIAISDELIFNSPDSSRKYANLALAKGQEIGDTAAIAKACNYLGILAYSQGYYLTALEFYQRSQNAYKSVNDNFGAMKAANNIGIIYTSLEEFEKAINIYEEAFNQNMKLGEKAAATSNLFNQAICYLELEQRDKAKQKLIALEKLYAEAGGGADPSSLKAEIFLLEKNADSALHHLNISIRIADSINDDFFLVGLYIQRADAFRMKRNYDAAKVELELASNIIDRNELHDQKLALLKMYSDVLADEGHFSKAFLLQNQYLSLKDSLDHINNFNRISELNAKYETEKQETMIARQEQELSKKSLQFRIVFILGIAVLAITCISLYNLVRKRRMNKLLSTQNDEIKTQRQKIISSIDYARRIQRSILPSEEVVKSFFPQSFVYFRPRDIVSGDFYWMRKIENKILVAIADCTGHGVPGAFMSVIANSKLNTVVDVQGKRDPGDILHCVHKEIVNMLNQRDAMGNAQDGMDISLCLIDTEERTIEFSGANNSIMIMRQNELNEFKAVPLSLGGVAHAKSYNGSNPFQTQVIRYHDGDYLFMYTDGMLDQLGGADNKKFNKERFRGLLRQLQAMQLNRAIVTCDAFVSQWRMNTAQTDDILLFGTKL